MSDPERAVISVTTRIADLGSCTDCQQGGLLQLCSRWYPRPARRSECIIPLIPLLRELHWLRVPERVTLRLCVLAYTAVFMEQRRRTLLRACTGHLTSTLNVVCALLTQTFNTRWPCLPSGFGTCVEQPAVDCQECTVADDVPSRAEDCTFPVVV